MRVARSGNQVLVDGVCPAPLVDAGVHGDQVQWAPSTLWQSRVQTLAKRLIDVFGAGVALLLLSPVLLCAAVLVRLSSPGPILFRQNRVGKDGLRFEMYKFRTMYADNDP